MRHLRPCAVSPSISSCTRLPAPKPKLVSGLLRLKQSKGLIFRHSTADFFEVQPKTLIASNHIAGTWQPVTMQSKAEAEAEVWISAKPDNQKYQIQGRRIGPTTSAQTEVLIFSLDEYDNPKGFDIIF